LVVLAASRAIIVHYHFARMKLLIERRPSRPPNHNVMNNTGHDDAEEILGKL
jgi:hypothetical protein